MSQVWQTHLHMDYANKIEFLDTHPGGAQVLLRCAGRDATNDFDAVHDIQILTQSLAPGAFKGNIEPGTLSKLPEKATRKTQADDIPPLSSIINLHDFEEVARRHLLPTTWAYFASGADDETSKHGNAKAYQKVTLRPRILRKIMAVNTSTHILGHAVTLPVYMSPVGIVKLAHPDGECALAAAAGQEGLVQVLANGSSIPVEKVMDSRVRKEQPIFCQLYVNRDIRKSEDMVRRAEKAGAGAIWLTVDSPVVGKRELDERVNLNVQVCHPYVPFSILSNSPASIRRYQTRCRRSQDQCEHHLPVYRLGYPDLATEPHPAPDRNQRYPMRRGCSASV